MNHKDTKDTKKEKKNRVNLKSLSAFICVHRRSIFKTLYSDFSLTKFKKNFNITIDEKADLFATVEPIEISKKLKLKLFMGL